MYVPTQQPTQHDNYNPILVIITLYHPWGPVSINDELEGKVKFSEDEEVDG